jgi:hypothetical protein
MSTFANAGIYVIIDLGSPDESINRNSPAWNTALFTRYTQVIDAFGNYTNVIGFFAGNEVANSANTTSAIPYVKAAVRDSKAYIKQKGYNKYVGYAAADVPDIRSQLANYLNCGPSSDSIDFFGDNVYEWCGDSSFQQSGYNNIVTEFQSYNVPYFFAEYGCNTVHPRTFTNIPTMYGPEMRDVLNGGILFEFFEDTNNFGMLDVAQGDSRMLIFHRSRLHPGQRRQQIARLHGLLHRDCQRDDQWGQQCQLYSLGHRRPVLPDRGCQLGRRLCPSPYPQLKSLLLHATHLAVCSQQQHQLQQV